MVAAITETAADPDRDLVSRCQSGDKAAFTEIFRKYHRLSFG
jgi:hypothetical protein